MKQDMIKALDRKILLAVFCVTLIGTLSLFSACHQGGDFVFKTIFIRQIIWFALGWIVLLLIANLNYKLFYEFAFVFYAVNVFLLILVLIIGRKILGAQRWLQFWDITFQPSELAKLTLIIVLARYFYRRSIDKFHSGLNFKEAIIIPFLLLSLPFLLVYIQPDLGTSIVLGLIFLSIVFSAGVKFKYILGLISVGIIGLPFIWHILKDYQRDRLLVFLNPNLDPLGAGYTIIQSKIAIGSGGIFGKGFLSGTQSQLNFLPERHTDFIFSLIAEEWGFVGGVILLLLYFFLIYKIIRIAYYAKEQFAQFLCVGIACVFMLHIFINIAMTSGICPVVGLPLPLISYGGSNLLINFIFLGIVFNIQKSFKVY